MQRNSTCFITAILPVLFAWALFEHKAHAEDLTCLASEKGGANATAITWYDALKQEALTTLAKRRERIEKLKTPLQIQEYQSELRQLMIKQLGGFPDRCSAEQPSPRTHPSQGIPHRESDL